MRGKNLRIIHVAAQAAAAIVCLGAAYYPVRLAYAEYLFRSNVPATMEHAAGLVPSQAEYQARLHRLERAVRLNPYLSSAWIELGLRAEGEGDFTKAEAALREATRVDRTFEPSWTLANFYFRRENREEFWKRIRIAAEMSYGDRSALFQLCWQATKDPEVILTRAIPSQGPILGDYLAYLARTGRLDAAEVVAADWLPLASPEDLPRLLQFCDLLIEKAHRSESAARIWNAMIGRGWLPFPRLDPAAGSSLTNGAFQWAPIGHGFDWRLLATAGVHILRAESPPQLRIRLDGHQLEQSDILVQWLPLTPSSLYELSLRARSQDIPPESGLRWQIYDAVSGASLFETKAAADIGPHIGMDALGETLRFATTPHCSLARLVLTYKRMPGTTRIEGELILSSVALERKPATPRPQSTRPQYER